MARQCVKLFGLPFCFYELVFMFGLCFLSCEFDVRNVRFEEEQGKKSPSWFSLLVERKRGQSVDLAYVHELLLLLLFNQ